MEKPAEGRVECSFRVDDGAAPSGPAAKYLQFEGDAGQQSQDYTRGDKMDRTLDSRPANKADGIEQRTEIADVEGSFLAVEPHIGQRPLRPFFGRAGQKFLELALWHADMTLSRMARGHAESIPTSAGRDTLVQALLSAGFSAQVE